MHEPSCVSNIHLLSAPIYTLLIWFGVHSLPSAYPEYPCFTLEEDTVEQEQSERIVSPSVQNGSGMDPGIMPAVGLRREYLKN